MLRNNVANEREQLEARVLAFLPDHAPGVSARAVYAHLATWSPYYTDKLLRRLERAERIASALVPHEKPQTFARRQFWRRLAGQ